MARKKYVNSHKEIDLKVVLNEYQTLIKEFYDWFFRRGTEIFSKELKEFAEIDREIGRLNTLIF